MPSSLKQLTLPGLKQVSIFKILQTFFKEVKLPLLILRSKAIAFSFFMALFPTIIFIFTFITILPIDNLANNIIGYLKHMLPDNQMLDFFIPLINETITKPKVSLFSVGLLLVMFFMKNGVVTTIQSFNIHFEKPSKTEFLRIQIVSLFITFLGLLIFLMTVFLIVFWKTMLAMIFNYFDYEQNALIFLIDIFRYVITIVMNYFLISCLYYYGPSKKNLAMDFHNIGAIIVTAGSVLMTFVFSHYIHNYAFKNNIYGSLGIVLILLIWIYWYAILVLVGFEINRIIFRLSHNRQKK
ncbi:MAG: YihY/virulence factor BrkB family protein [Chitinophagales bacterium]|jgi:membrane protein|nr:YihY/virulence factor BrkB family protein [Chitinophagales bacterium]